MKNRKNKTNAELIKENEMLHKKVNELENAEEAVLESEEKYRSLTEHLNVGVYRNTIGAKGRFIEANPAIVEMFGYKKKNEFLKLNVADLYKKSGERKNFNEKMISEGFVRNEEIQLQKSDGTFFFGSVSAVAVKDEKGKVKYYDGIIEDITERKQIEDALRESESRLKTKLDYILSSDKDVKNVNLTDLVDIKDLQEIQDAFAVANDVASIISDIDGKPITRASNFCSVCEIIRSTEKGNRNCIKSDKILGKKAKTLMKPTYEKCLSCGFVDASAPIIIGGKHIANWLIGQSNVMDVGKNRIKTYAKEIGADTNKILDAFEKMPQMSLTKFEQILDLLWYFTKELSILGYDNLKLVKNIIDIKQAEDKEKEHRKNIELLSEAAMRFVELPQDKDIYNFIGEQLHELVGKNSYVVVNSVDTDKNILTTRAVIGMGKLSEKVVHFFGRHPVGVTYNAKDKDIIYLSDGKLHLYEKGLYEISLKTIPKIVCNSIEKLLNIKTIYGIGFTKDNELFGNIIIFLKKGAVELKNKQILETFLKQASIAIQKRQAEETLLESEEKYRTLVELLVEGIVAVDKNENFTFVNPATCKIFGYTKEELLQMNFKEILTPEYHQKILQQTSKRKTGKIGKYDMNIIKKNGDICIVTTSVSPIFKNGEFKGSFGIFQDITERKKTEQALHKYTLELQERNEELDAFSHTVAHDLKNPLGTIMGFAEFLFEDYSKFSKDEILSYLNIIIKDSKKTQQIIDNLLLFASVRKAEIKMEELNMRDIVAESINSLTSIIEKSNAEIILSDVLPPSLGYAPWVEEVWTNYLSNAIKYGGTPPRIKIGADTNKAENVPKGMVRFWIRDNGQGISTDNRRLLFEKFERLDQITTEGHGLGLSIVRRIIEKLGGQVGMESKQGKGSLFYFTLPFATNTLPETRNLKFEI